MSSKQGDKYSELLEPFMSKFKEIVSDKVYCELEEEFNNCMIENNTYYAVAGMKMAVVWKTKKRDYLSTVTNLMMVKNLSRN